MGVRFSLVYPTRHRPAFIKQALRFLEKQKYQNFEVIISDNYLDPALSCENECRNSSLASLKYVHPPEPVDMVGNWNYALQFASGDYICYFTDKMFLLPDILSLANRCIEKSRSEIVNWTDNTYTPKKIPDYFGEGTYNEAANSVPIRADFTACDPREELSKKGRAHVSRNEQDKSSYASGKICFGAYSSELCNRIVSRTGTLFHNVSPDYTSMILGLSMAGSAARLARPGIVHINTDLSNGGQGAIHDELALKFLNDFSNKEEILGNYLVPGLYSSPHNGVSHDYLTLKKKYGLGFEFDRINWLVYITEDLDVEGRQWSTKEVENHQRGILQSFIDNLPKDDQLKYQKRLAERARTIKRQARPTNLRRIIKAIVPEIVIKTLIRSLSKPQPSTLRPNVFPTIEDILK